jgi:2'-5' RNA ligase
MPAPVSWTRPRRLENHWTWRPDWRVDRPCLWWYLTFEDRPELGDELAPLRAALRHRPELDVIPPRWLHLTLCEAGFVDELSPDRVAAAVAAVTEALAGQPPLTLSLGPLTTMSGAMVLDVTPVDTLRQLRAVVRGAMATVGVAARQGGEASFWPHVSMGYLNRRSDPAALMDALSPVSEVSAEVTVDRLRLAAVTRRDRHYQWDTHTELRLRELQGSRAGG